MNKNISRSGVEDDIGKKIYFLQNPDGYFEKEEYKINTEGNYECQVIDQNDIIDNDMTISRYHAILKYNKNNGRRRK